MHKTLSQALSHITDFYVYISDFNQYFISQAPKGTCYTCYTMLMYKAIILDHNLFTMELCGEQNLLHAVLYICSGYSPADVSSWTDFRVPWELLWSCS